MLASGGGAKRLDFSEIFGKVGSSGLVNILQNKTIFKFSDIALSTRRRLGHNLKYKMGNDKSKFREKVYKIVKQIPSGKVLTYKVIAKLAGSPRAWRAVGNVLNKNLDKTIPCHRVIRSNGKIGGYRKGTKKKIALLKKEGIIIEKSEIIKTKPKQILNSNFPF